MTVMTMNVMKDLFWPLTMTVMTMTMQIMMKDVFWPLAVALVLILALVLSMLMTRTTTMTNTMTMKSEFDNDDNDGDDDDDYTEASSTPPLRCASRCVVYLYSADSPVAQPPHMGSQGLLLYIQI